MSNRSNPLAHRRRTNQPQGSSRPAQPAQRRAAPSTMSDTDPATPTAAAASPPGRSIRARLFGLTLLPLILALKPLASRMLTTWTSRQTVKFSSWLAGIAGVGSAAAQQYQVAIVAGAVAVSGLLLELSASWLADKARGGGGETLLLLVLAGAVAIGLPGCVAFGVRVENRDGHREASVFVDLDDVGRVVGERLGRDVSGDGSGEIEVRPALPLDADFSQGGSK